MGHIDAHATVAAPPQKVYAYVADPRNAPHYISAFKAITSGPQGAGKVGDRYNANAEFMGQPAYITLRLADLVNDQRVTMALEGEPSGNIHIQLVPTNNGQYTQVQARLDVPSVPGFLLEMMMGNILRDGMHRLAATLGAK